MKAVVFRKGRGLVYEDVPDYKIAHDEVLVRVANTGFCGSDHSLVAGGHLSDGYILGHEISAVVVEKGAAASGPPVGTRVCIRPSYCGRCINCRSGRPHLCRVERRTTGIGDLPGGFAQFVKAFGQMLIPIPDGVDSQNAALAETFAAALHGIHCTSDRAGPALVMGGGPIGLCTVRLLKILGYSPVVLFEPVAVKRNIGVLYGADHVFDPLEKNADQQALAVAPGGYRKIFECSGVKANISRAVLLAEDAGEICIVSMIFSAVSLEAPFLINLKEIRLTASNSNTHEENIQCLQWMAEGKIDARPLISDYAPLSHLPALYRERIDTGLAVKVLLQIGEEF
ncbi:MAG: alcohol dehydrogenase catalytic domain-containing protein [Smithellaceae bacterium]|nr:alcohol dehydrogenase catalytic domain-containing protein [Smithellaceae bacterium]NLX52191.1 alcohol dehydrogenase catalytic domain-containing protein [Deltaproteobacteria bacterium]